MPSVSGFTPEPESKFSSQGPAPRTAASHEADIESVPYCEVLGDHGTVKGDKLSSVGKVGEQRSDVAVADEDFGMRGNLIQVERREQIICPIPAACTEDRPDIIPHEHFFQFAGSPVNGAGEVQVLFEDGLEVERVVAQAPQGVTTGGQQFRLDVAGGGHNADRVSGLEGGRLAAFRLGLGRHRDIR